MGVGHPQRTQPGPLPCLWDSQGGGRGAAEARLSLHLAPVVRRGCCWGRGTGHCLAAPSPGTSETGTPLPPTLASKRSWQERPGTQFASTVGMPCPASHTCGVERGQRRDMRTHRAAAACVTAPGPRASGPQETGRWRSRCDPPLRSRGHATTDSPRQGRAGSTFARVRAPQHTARLRGPLPRPCLSLPARPIRGHTGCWGAPRGQPLAAFQTEGAPRGMACRRLLGAGGPGWGGGSQPQQRRGWSGPARRWVSAENTRRLLKRVRGPQTRKRHPLGVADAGRCGSGARCPAGPAGR